MSRHSSNSPSSPAHSVRVVLARPEYLTARRRPPTGFRAIDPAKLGISFDRVRLELSASCAAEERGAEDSGNH